MTRPGSPRPRVHRDDWPRRRQASPSGTLTRVLDRFYHATSVRARQATGALAARRSRGAIFVAASIGRERKRRGAQRRADGGSHAQLARRLEVSRFDTDLTFATLTRVRADGTKELIALADRHRESTESWADLLRSAKRRGMAAPVLVVGDGALGFWAAVRDVFPETREQRCWFHKIANVLNCLPKSAQPAAKTALAEIYNAEDREHAEAAVKAFADLYGTKWPKAVAKISDDLDLLLAFYDYPAEHWVHLRTTNPIESTFATVRLRQRVTKGPGSRAAGVAMAFKLIESAQTRWRCVNAPHLVALVRAGARFEKGVLVERPDDQGGDQQVA